MMEMNLIQTIIIYVLPILFAVVVHEVAHGWAACKLGDKTALMLGRLTLNPFRHIDLFGTILVPFILLKLGGFVFGWAKPVPINPRNFKKPRRDMALVALAGPLANFLMACLWAGIFKASTFLMPHYAMVAAPLLLMGKAGIMVNIFLMILNLIPIPPLDGSRIVAAFLHGKMLYYYARLEHYGFFILLLLIVTQALNYIVLPGVVIIQSLIVFIFRL